jgi:two-component system response regulator BaeR
VLRLRAEPGAEEHLHAEPSRSREHGGSGLDGLSVLREVRAFSRLRVILVTARVVEIDRLLGLELGADDYVCKPYSPREVLARVAGQRLDLTPKELKLLQALVERPGRVLSRAQLLDLVYQDDLDVSERAVDSHMKNLRRKLAQAAPERELIRSVYGVGFAFEP